MCVSSKEECVTDEEDEGGQMNETPWQGKKGVICPDIPEEEQGTPERGVHDENGTNYCTSSSNELIIFLSFLLSLLFLKLILCQAQKKKQNANVSP